MHVLLVTGANDTDKSEVDLVMRDIRNKMEGNVGPDNPGVTHGAPSRGTPTILLKIPES